MSENETKLQQLAENSAEEIEAESLSEEKSSKDLTKNSEADDLSADRPECPAGTTWDPITKTCV